MKKRQMLIVGLAMAIGWGIRGNFGHQYGAAFAGCLATIAACLLSGREDWRRKVLYFGFFGAIGWGFGATISYMQVISYTESGQAATQLFGYTCLFIIGFLWASLGVAASAFVAAAEPAQLAKLFKVILYVFAAWLVLDIVEDPVATWLQPGAGFDDNASRQKNPLYWFDATYLPPLFALIAACVYDLAERKNKNGWFLPLFAGTGALCGWLVQYLLRRSGTENKVASLFTFQLGDLSYTDPVTHLPAYSANDLLNNWPQWFSDYPHAVGWFIGLIAGIIFYFVRFGKFRDGSSLIVYMAGGWLLFFIVFPVLGSLLFIGYGGIRMTPPRSDDWAGMTGVFFGVITWMRRNRYISVATISVISGAIGGIGFSGVQWVKQLMMAPGNPRILLSQGMVRGSAAFDTAAGTWAHWQQQNWHSFLEQSYGFVNGLAVAIGLTYLAKRIPETAFANDIHFKKWMRGVCTVFILLAVPYVNLIKNVETWSENLNPAIWTREIKDGVTGPALWDAPYVGRLPHIHFLHLTPEGWYNATWILLLLMAIALIRKHFRQPLSFVPPTWTGRSQLILLILLWVMVLGNFERELLLWSPGRLLTEWMITAYAILLTYLIISSPQNAVRLQPTASVISFKRACVYALAAVVISAPLFLLTNRMVYRYDPKEVLDTKRYHLRFGPDADWRSRPILKTAQHK